MVGDVEGHGVVSRSGGDGGAFSVFTSDHVVGVLAKDGINASVDEEGGEPSFNLDNNVGSNAEIVLDFGNRDSVKIEFGFPELGEVGSAVDLDVLADENGTLGEDVSSLVDSSLDLLFVGSEEASSSS